MKSNSKRKPQGKSVNTVVALERKHDDSSSDSDNELVLPPTRNFRASDTKPVVSVTKAELMLGQRGGLEVTPTRVQFLCVIPELLYSMKLTILNASNKPQRIQIRAPTSSNFAIRHFQTSSIAPGMISEVEVEFQTNSSNLTEFIDEIVISSQYGSITVPLLATIPQATISFPSLLDFGQINVGSIETRSIRITNTGSRSCTVKFDAPDTSSDPNMNEIARIKFFPETIVLGASQHTARLQKRMSVTADDTASASMAMSTDSDPNIAMPSFADVLVKMEALCEGDYRGIYKGTTLARLSDACNGILDICAHSTVADIHILVKQNENLTRSQSLSFGHSFRGRQVRKQVFLVNESALPQSFAVNCDVTTNPESDESERNQSGAVPFTCDPRGGVLKPHSRMSIDVIFSPPFDNNSKGFQARDKESVANPKNCAAALNVDLLETGTSIILALNASTSSPGIFCDPSSVLDFGNCMIGEKNEMPIMLTNYGKAAVNYKFRKHANFKMIPSAGQLQSSESCRSLVVFKPSQLGRLSQCLIADVEENLFTLRIDATGMSTNDSSVRQQFVKTTDCDECTVTNTVQSLLYSNDSSTFSSNSIRKQLNALRNNEIDLPWDKHDDNQEPLALRMSYNAREVTARSLNRTKYVQVVTDGRRERKEMKEAISIRKMLKSGLYVPNSGIQFGDSLDIGLSTSMKPPQVVIPRNTEPLWLKKPLGSESDNRRLAKSTSENLDENRLIQVKFKSAPDTQTELKECSMELSSEELHCLIPSHRSINFGDAVTGCRIVKSLSIQNNGQKHVIVETNSMDTELSQIYPASQVIPPNSTGGFDVSFCPIRKGDFNGHIAWTVNKIHTFKCSVLAKIKPVEVELSTTDIEFRFDDNQAAPFVEQEIQLRNVGNFVCEYTWNSHGSFSISPDRGKIDGSSIIKANIKWAPSTAFSNDEILTLRVVGGDSKDLRVRGILPECKCTILERSIDVGTISCGSESKFHFRIRNACLNNAAANFDILSNDVIVNIEPSRVLLTPGETKIIAGTIIAKRHVDFSGITLVASIRGGKSIKLPFSGHSIIPEIKLSTNLIEFSSVRAGTCSIQPLTIINKNESIAATIAINCESSDVVLSISPQSCSSRKKESIQDLAGTQSSSKSTSITLQCDDTGNSLSVVSGTRGASKYELKLNCSSQIILSVTYSPRIEIVEMLPISLRLKGLDEVLADVMLQCQCLPALLNLSSSEIDFGEEVIPKALTKKMPRTKLYEIKNVSQETIFWSIKTLEEAGFVSAFYVSPSEGTLRANDGAMLNVTFSPVQVGENREKMGIFVGQQNAAQYSTLLAKGDGVRPSVLIESDTVSFPPTPIGMKSETCFWIQNRDFESVYITCTLSPFCPVPIEIKFPDGRYLGIACNKIRVVLCFLSDRSVSFCSNLDIVLDCDDIYSIQLSGIVDNSVLITYPYTLSRESSVEFWCVGDGAPQLVEKISAASAVEDEGKSPVIPLWMEACRERLLKEAIFLTAWLCYQTGVISPEHFVPCVDSSTYHIMSSIVDELSKHSSSSKKLPARSQDLDSKIASNGWNVCQNMIQTLQDNGCLVRHLFSEYLLPWDEFVVWKEASIEASTTSLMSRSKAKELLDLWRKDHERQAPYVWMEIMCNIVKAFFLSKLIDPDTLHAKKMSGEKASKTVSNVYNEKEILVMKWLRLNAVRSNMTGGFVRRFVDFSSDLVDGAILCHCVAYHAPWLTEPLTPETKPQTNTVAPSVSRLRQRETVSESPLVGFVGASETVQLQQPAIRAQNAEKLVSAMKMLKSDLGIDSTILLNSGARCSLSVAIHLFISMPNFIPRSTLSFKEVLGSSQSKEISIKNVTEKRILFSPVVYGDTSAFSVSAVSFSIDPGVERPITVTYQSKLSKMSKARLILWRDRECVLNASNMTYLLEGQPNGRYPLSCTSISLPCYEYKNQEVVLTNPFDKAGVFKLSFEQTFLPAHIKSKKKKAKRLGMVGNGSGITIDFSNLNRKMMRTTLKEKEESDESLSKLFVDTCWLSEEDKSVRLGPKMSMTVLIHVLPFFVGCYQSQLVATDESVGEFAVDVITNSELPISSDIVEFSVNCQLNEAQDGLRQFSKSLMIPSRNNALERAFTLLCDSRLHPSVRTKARSVFQSLFSPKVGGLQRYLIDSSNAEFSLQSDVILISMESHGQTTKKEASSSSESSNSSMIKKATIENTPENQQKASDNSVIFTMSPVSSGEYRSQITIRPASGCPVDIRVIEVVCKASYSQLACALSMKCAANSQVVQDLPLENSTDRPVRVSASFSGSNSFSGPAMLVLQAGEQTTYPIKFYPDSSSDGDCQSHLRLVNLETNERAEYSLTGSPLQEVIKLSVESNCKTKTEHIVEIPIDLTNYHGNTTYVVAMDMRGLSGPQIFEAVPNATNTLELSYYQTQCGTYSGVVEIEDMLHTRKIFCDVVVNVMKAEAKSQIDLSTLTRTAVAAQITLENSSPSIVSFQVEMSGNDIYGADSIVLAPRSSNIYELVYAPLLPGFTSGTLSFRGSDGSEFWYSVNLTAEQPPIIRLEEVQCMIGSSSSRTIEIENPLRDTITINPQLSDSIHFSVKPKTLLIEPLSFCSFEVFYSPSTVSERNSCIITIESDMIGLYSYELSGYGLDAGQMPESVTISTLGESAFNIVPFRNPFMESLIVRVNLTTERRVASNLIESKQSSIRLLQLIARDVVVDDAVKIDDIFVLQMPRTTSIHLNPNEILSMPIKFVPSSMQDSVGKISVEVESGKHAGVVWTIPLRGKAQFARVPSYRSYRCKSKGHLQDDIAFNLTSLPKLNGAMPQVEYIPYDSEMSKITKRFVRLVMLKQDYDESIVVCRVNFDPLKECSFSGDVVITHQNGSKWAFEVSFEGAEPDPDELFEIICPVGSQSFISFKLANRLLGFVDYEAYFLPDSSKAFSIYPSQGSLPPHGSEGLEFQILYAPLEYGGDRGRLVVMTQEVQWLFHVVGRLPEFVPPT